MSHKRNKAEIVLDILLSISQNNNQIKITHLLRKANLSHEVFKKYSNELEEKEYIELTILKKQHFYSLTPKGYEQISKLKPLKEFMNTFDL